MQKLADLKSFITTEKRSRSYSEWKKMWAEILDKFTEYFEWEQNAPTYCQKGLIFLRRQRLLDPKQDSELQPTISELKLIPLLRKVPVHQLQSYIDEVSSVSPKTTLGYWKDRLERWPALAKGAILSLSIPSHSCEVERSFSAYSRIATNLRTTMSDSTLSTCNMLHYNCLI